MALVCRRGALVKACASIGRWRVVVRCVATYPVQTGCTPFMSAHAKDTLIAYAASKAPLELSGSLSSRLCSRTNHSSPANTRWKVDFYRLDSFLFRLDVAGIYLYILNVGRTMLLSSLNSYICTHTISRFYDFGFSKFEEFLNIVSK